jgi:predicted PurR-regulated permease PerM
MPTIDTPENSPRELPPSDLKVKAVEEGTALGEQVPSPDDPVPVKTVPTQWVLIVLGMIALLYFARPVVLPVFLAILGSMALRPLMRWLAVLRLPTHLSAALVFALLVAALFIGFFQIARPAATWMDEAPEHIADLKARVQKLFPNAIRMSHALDAVTDMGVAAPPDGKKVNPKVQPATVEIKDQRGTTSILNWTGTVLAGLGEVLVLIYLILASGDLFLHKLVRVMPTLKDKKQAIEISHEIQQNISNYLFTVTLINVCLGIVVAAGLFILGVPKPAMWGVLVALLNYVPYFGPVVGVGLLGVVGVLSFDTLWQGLMPGAWYLALHLLEANFVTPILLGRRFTLNPVAIFISLMFWLWLWGVPGALLSVPILVLVKAVCDRFPRAAYMSELIGS